MASKLARQPFRPPRGRVMRRRFRRRRRQQPFRRAADEAELKFHDVDVDDGTVAAAMNVQLALLTIAEGNGESERVGRKINVKQINWRFEVLLPTTATAADTSDVIRVMMVLDKQCNGALPTNTDVVETDDYQSFNNLSNRQRFRVLMDRTYDVNCPAGSGRGSTDTLSYGDSVVSDQWHSQRLNIPIEYDNSFTTGVITTIRSNNLFIIVGGKSGVAGFRSKLRIRFTDR